MHGIRAIAVTGMLSLALAGCMSSGSGGDAGSSVLALASPASAAAGGLIGGAVGDELSAADRRAAQDAEFRALEYGRIGTPVQWRGSSGRYYGDVVAGTQYQVNDFACRDYTHTIYINGQPQVARGTACRQPDGTWKAIG